MIDAMSSCGTTCRSPGWFGTAAIEGGVPGHALDIGRLSRVKRGAKSQAVAVFRVGACGRLRHHSATAKL